jgi:predicted metal-binding membrane protein
VHSGSFATGIGRRDRVVIWSCVLLAAALAWTYLVFLDRQMSSSALAAEAMAKMGMALGAPWRASDVFFTFLMWSVMMIGMMSASAIPVLLLFGEMQARRGSSRVSLPVLLLASGYLSVWLGFSAAATLAQWALREAALLSATLAASSAPLGGGILIAAGAYQLTPVKSACLRRCQSPLGFLMTHWHEGDRGAVRMGLLHGTNCLGCCWALMTVLFAVGVMNLAWIALLTAFILLEKAGVGGLKLVRVAGAIMIVAGIFVAAG